MEAKNAPMTAEKIKEQLNKTGDSEFFFEQLDVVVGEKTFLPVGKIKELRRMAFEQLKEKLLQGYMEKLSGFGELKEEYNKYTFDYLKADEKYCDRMDILNVIDQTIRKEARIERINIHANGVEVTFEGVNLEQTSILATKIEAYDNVKSVSIVSASLSSKTGTYSVVMDIYFKSVEGGKQ